MNTILHPILEVHHLNKSYKDFALQEVSFSLPEGCITGFIGANGAGKTTTLHTLLGLTGADSGEIRFLGMDMQEQAEEIKNRIGVVLDSNCFYEGLTLNQMKNIIAPAYSRWCEEDYQRYLRTFSLNPKQTIKTLSKGMRVKYALTLALSHKAEDKIADTLILIDDGKILFQEEKDVLLDSYRIVKGDVCWLTADTRPLFINVSETAFGFTALTWQAARVQAMMPEAVMERPHIEDIMLGVIGENVPAKERR